MLALDPGGTTGWALFEEGDLTDCGQVPGSHTNHRVLIKRIKPEVVVAEKYFIYAWKAAEHSWSDLLTPRLIGGIEMYCSREKIALVIQTAQDAKAFNTDEKLRAWNMYHPGKVHANDAIRHGCHFLLFNWRNYVTVLESVRTS